MNNKKKKPAIVVIAGFFLMVYSTGVERAEILIMIRKYGCVLHGVLSDCKGCGAGFHRFIDFALFVFHHMTVNPANHIH